MKQTLIHSTVATSVCSVCLWKSSCLDERNCKDTFWKPCGYRTSPYTAKRIYAGLYNQNLIQWHLEYVGEQFCICTWNTYFRQAL